MPLDTVDGKLDYCDNKSTNEELLHRAKLPTYAATASHCNHNVQSQKWPGASLHCGLIFCYQFSEYHLRNHDFVVPRFRTGAYGKHSLIYLGPAIWSKLDISIRLSESLGTFKKRIKLVNFTSLLDSTC